MLPKVKDVLETLKLLADWVIRTKNAVCVLLALLAVIIVYFTSKNAQWFQELREDGAIGVRVALVVVFVVAFLGTHLIHSAVAGLLRKVMAPQREKQVARFVQQTLEGRTPWQITFLSRFVTEGITQIPEWEVGGYRALWGCEMDVLINKKIVARYPGGMYEISPKYYEYLRRKRSDSAEASA